MLRISTAAICAALVLASPSAASAGTTTVPVTAAAETTAPAGDWIKVAWDNGYAARSGSADPNAGEVIITLHLGTTTAWAYDPAKGGLNIIPVPSQSVSTGPIRGSVVKGGKNPGGNYSRVIGNFDGNGVAAFDPTVPAGNYDVAITIPSASLAAAKKHVGAVKYNDITASKGATITFHLVLQAPTDASSMAAPQSAVSSPRDPQSGLASGKRMHKPLLIYVDRNRAPTVVIQGTGSASSQ